MKQSCVLVATLALVVGQYAAADNTRDHDTSTAAILSPHYDPDRPAWSPMASSTTLYETGFEPGEGFTLGPINGQQGWTNFLDNDNIPATSESSPFAGSQHLRNSKGPGANSSFNGAFSPDLGPQPAGRYTASVEFASNDAGGADHMLVGQAPSQGFLSWRIHFDWQNRILVLDDIGAGLVFVDTGHTWSPDGQYRNVTVELDYNADTIDYYYDGNLIYSSAAGVFAGTSIEQVILFSDNWYTTGGWGDWDNLEITTLPGDPTLSLNPNPTVCYQVGDIVTVNVDMTDMQDIVVGGQFFLQYDPSRLQFQSAAPGDVPFTLEIFSQHVSPFIDYAVGVEPPPVPQGTDADTTMAVFTFTALDEVCADEVANHPLVWFRPHVPPTRLTDEFGQEVMPLDLDDLEPVTIDSTPPNLTVPSDVVLDCTEGPWYAGSGECAGICGAQAPSGCWCDAACAGFGDCCEGICNDCPDQPQCDGSAGLATATDNCDPDPVITFVDTIIPSGVCPQEFTVEREWTATDCSGNTTSDTQLIMIVDDTAPTVSGVPSDITVYADAGQCGAVVTWTSPTATDNCTDTADIAVSSTHSSGEFFPAGQTQVSYAFTDECGNTSKVNFTVEVLPVSQMTVDVSLQATVDPGPFTRCIEFELTDSNGNVIEVVPETLTFTNGQATATIEVPCGAYGDCIAARDPLHTLRSTGELQIVGTEYDAFSFDPLHGGDLNDDGVVDILDFGFFVFQFGQSLNPDTDCTTAAPHADLTGDGGVGTGDFGFIQINFLAVDQMCPITLMAGQRGLGVRPKPTPQPRTQISVRELHRMGLGHLEVADLTGDGWVGPQDIAAFAAGARPE